MKTTELHIAAASGDPRAVCLVLLGETDVNARSEPNGFTPLHMCVSGTDDKNRQEIIKFLHDDGADLEAKTYDKALTPLQLAAMRNKPLCVAALIRCGANVHATEGNGASALHAAAYYGYAEVSKILIEAGADPGLIDLRGNTPLSIAKQGKHHDIVALLSDKLAGNATQTDGKNTEIADTNRDGVEIGMTKEQLLQKLEHFAREDRQIISSSIKDHFEKIVEIMDLVGATRHGSQRLQGSDGRYYIFDNYTLPSGGKVKAGYEDDNC